jgi:hypothetical protein
MSRLSSRLLVSNLWNAKVTSLHVSRRRLAEGTHFYLRNRENEEANAQT